VPAAVLDGTELIHLGGGESLPCPGVERLPLAPSARHLGLGSPSLALPPARAHVLRDVTLCPTSRTVLDREGRIVAESLSSDMVGRVGPDERELSSAALEIEGTVAIYRSPWRPYFHMLIDHLPRAALLAQPAMRRLGPITLVHDGPLPALEQHLLSNLLPARVRLQEVEAGRRVLADRVVLPGYVTRPASGAIPSWYRRWVDREAAAASPAGVGQRARRRIFIDRVASPRRVINRAELEPVLERHGIEVVEPSVLAPEEEMALFRDAELVIGVTGSGLANSLFSRGAHVIELVPGTELLPHFFYLATAKGLPYDYVLSPPDRQRLSAEERLRRDVVVDTARLDELLSARR
jgi:capsular polysaccharide biosynthesis protein